MTTENIDDLMFLRNCIDASLPEDFIKVTFKDGYTTVYTRLERVAGICNINIADSPSIVSAYNVLKECWENIDISTIDTAESQDPTM